MPELLLAADDPAHAAVRGLLWYALADWAYPPALARMVHLLDDPDDDVVIASAFALDTASGGLLRVEARFLERGWPDYDGMRAALPGEARRWWDAGGYAALPDEAAWRQAAQPGASDRGLDPALLGWVLEHQIAVTGRMAVVRDLAEELPAGHGTHLVPGTVPVDGKPVKGVVLVDSDAGRIVAVLVPSPEPPGWHALPPDGAVPAARTAGVP
ncbi:MAG: hypothetical protein R3F59_01825 [Myxococcota bacterium]